MGEGTPHKFIDVQIQGTAEAKANLKVWVDKMPMATGQAFLEEMQDTMKESQVECPWDYENEHLDGTPHLRNTANSEMVIEEGSGKVVVYGSYSTPYAVYVHEILENHHIYPTKAKFLEDPANRRAKVLIGNVAQKLGKVMQ